MISFHVRWGVHESAFNLKAYQRTEIYRRYRRVSHGNRQSACVVAAGIEYDFSSNLVVITEDRQGTLILRIFLLHLDRCAVELKFHLQRTMGKILLV